MYDLFIETKERGDGTASGIKKKKELERLKIFKQKKSNFKKASEGLAIRAKGGEGS